MTSTPRPRLGHVLRRSYELTGSHRLPWLTVVGLALTVSVFEGLGAVMLYALLGLMTDPFSAIELPIVGSVDFITDTAVENIFLVAAVVIAVFFVLRGIVVVAQTYVLVRVTENAGARLATTLHHGYLAMPYSGRGSDDSAEQIRNAHDTVHRFVDGFLIPAVTLVSEVMLVAGLTGVLIITVPLATAVSIGVVLPVVIILNRLVQPRLSALGRRMQQLTRNSLKTLHETLEGRDDIRIAGGTRHFGQRFAEIRHGFARTSTMRWTLAKIPAVGLETALVLFIAVLLAGSALTDRDVATILPVLGLFGYTGLRMIPSLERSVTALNSLRFTTPAVDDLYDEFQRVTSAAHTDVDDTTPLAFVEHLSVDSVSYRYPSASTDALTGINLSIDAGSFIGIVGPTGGGKSTLVELLVGLRPPATGSVCVDGRSIHADPHAWQRAIGYVPQSVFLIDDTLRRNIALGVDDNDVDEGRLAAAIEGAQLAEVVSGLADGIDAVVGERGARLSGGQRQRVAIARALYRQPTLIVLDEGTAALDAQTEAALLESIQAMRDDRTLIVVTHRVSSLEHCDIIHIIGAGRVVASGSFDHLNATHAGFRALLNERDEAPT